MPSLPGFSHESPYQGATNEWFTPPWVFEALGLEFDLDPCSPSGGLPWIPAKEFWSVHDNALLRAWKGRVWLNPPYGPLTGKFLARMHEHRDRVALVFARTAESWFHDYAAKADAILFLRGRIRFVEAASMKEKSGAGSGSVLIAWGRDNVEALRRMESRGLLWVRPGFVLGGEQDE